MSRATVERAGPTPVVTSDAPVFLVGAGPAAAADLRLGQSVARELVAADGGARALIEAGVLPNAVIGDMDSLTDELRARIPTEVVYPITDQDSTDFEKCLTRIDAPLVLAAGFSGGRMDHLLAVFNAMVRHPQRRCVLVGPDDIGLLVPPVLEMAIPAGATVSLFPLAPVAVQSQGLHWPVAGLPFRPDGQVGTSNRAVGPVELTCDGPGMLLFLPRDLLGVLLEALAVAPRW